MNYVLSPLTLIKRRKASHKKILFIKLLEIGNIILAYPLLNKVRREFPEAGMFFLTFEENKPLFQILDVVPSFNILTIRRKSICSFILDTLRVTRKLRKEKVDIVFDLELFSRFTAILTLLTAAYKRVGFYRYSMEGLYRGGFLTHRVQYNPLVHISKSYLSLWQAAKGNKKFTPELEKKIENEEIFLPRFIPSEERKRQIWDKLRRWNISEEARLLLVNPGEGNIPLREWSLENFGILARRLLEDKRNYIIIIGTDKTSNKAELLCRLVNDKRCLNLTHQTTLSEVLGLFSIAQALIANDCGLAHLASLTPIKKFVLFGPESPKVYAPLEENTCIIYSDLACSPCLSAFNHRNSICKNNRCLEMIKPEEVYGLIKAHLR